MANRSYLYASNGVDQENGSHAQRRTTGISEWNYDIPLVYKILASGHPRVEKSSIWTEAGDIAIVADFDLGVARLSRFLDGIPLALAQPLKDEALGFLADNRRSHFVLECGEIYDMDDGDMEQLNRQLLHELNDIESQIERAMADVSSLIGAPAPVPPSKRGWFARFAGSTDAPAASTAREDPLERIRSMGLGDWSTILYFDLGDD